METSGVANDFIGAGLSYRACYRDQLLASTSEISVLEIIPQHFFADPGSIDELAERFTLVFHDTDLPIATLGSDKTFFDARLQRLGELVDRAKPQYLSTHLALTGSPLGVDLGHLAPLWFTEELLQHMSTRISETQSRLQIPIALENLAGFSIPECEMSESEFLSALCGQTQCGVLLDLTNLLINARNSDLDPVSQMYDYPLGSVMQIHLAGGKKRQDHWIDSHSSSVDPDSFALLSALREHASPRAIIVERDQNFPEFSELVAEASRAESIWRGST